jgi:hypothetical protein
MKSWVITNFNGYPVAVRETEQDAIATIEKIATDKIRNNPDHGPAVADAAIIIPEFDGDNLRVKVYLSATRALAYDEIYAFGFDSESPPTLRKWGK